jgi:hypothetical protein
MSKFTQRYTNDLTLLLDKHVRTVKAQLPKYADSFEKRILDEAQRPFTAYLEKLEAIRTSGRYSPDGERAERRAATRTMREQLAKVREGTVNRLEAQLTEIRAAVTTPKSGVTDPLQAILKEMRHKELRDHLRTVDPLQLQVRIRQAADDGPGHDLLDALDGAPAGFPIAPAALVQETRERLALKNHPELGELAQLRDAYTYALGVVEQTAFAASGLSERELSGHSTEHRPNTLKPTFVNSGQGAAS